ncbi:endonuclease [Quadrisphaera oryzae]|uniref:endonuclease n=1 Tax=Quadrisphaera TaxID=317661 RepID=UPI001646C4BA|nr:endonuclease [Quadrisphaera sp. RL12-1S]MBC3761938.1 endonuclease [Quadrisphaera sp. RL12-1S]
MTQQEGPRDEVLRALLARHGRTYADEAGIALRDTPAPLLQLLVLSSLMSSGVSAELGVRAARGLRSAGLTTAEHLRDAGDDGRWQALADARYLRKRQTAHQLGQLADLLLEEHHGDLRRLRDDCDGERARVHEAVQRFSGIGPVGADVFCREAQAVWPSLRPFADDRVSATAKALGLPTTAGGLAELAGTDDLSVLGAALVRCSIADDADELRASGR